MDQSQEDELLRQATPQLIREIGATLRAVRSILIEAGLTTRLGFEERVENERLSPQVALHEEIWRQIFGDPPQEA